MGLLRGAAAGFVATIPMTLTMGALRAMLPREQVRPAPPREVVDQAVDKVVEKTNASIAPDHEDRTAMTAVAHFAFGTVAGAVYGALIDRREASSTSGVAYGLAVWALAYGVGLPSLDLHPAAQEDTSDRNQVLIASHVVWGAVLGAMAGDGHRRSG
jgi:uncharacterized membrane protein YagU involved in acid resistance